MSVLTLLLLLLLMIRALFVVELLDMFAGRIRLTPPTRIRRLSFGMSNGSSPKSTDVALPDAPEFC